MIDLLIAIAALCQVKASTSVEIIDRQQTQCQAFYTRCTLTNPTAPELQKCILLRAAAQKADE